MPTEPVEQLRTGLINVPLTSRRNLLKMQRNQLLARARWVRFQVKDVEPTFFEEIQNAHSLLIWKLGYTFDGELDWVSCRDKNLCHQYVYSRYGGGKTRKIPGENYWSMFRTIEDKYLADYYWNIQRPEIEHPSIDLEGAGYWKMDVYRKYYSASLLCRNCAPNRDL